MTLDTGSQAGLWFGLRKLCLIQAVFRCWWSDEYSTRCARCLWYTALCQFCPGEFHFCSLKLTDFQEKFGRTVDKVFQPECGFKMDRIERLTERYEDMIQRMVGWSTKCKRYSGENCPAYCELQDGECMMPKGIWFEISALLSFVNL